MADEATILESQQHKTPADVAVVFVHRGIGQRYRTASEVYNAKPEVVIQGLLMLILNELKTMNTREDVDALEKHRDFLECVHPMVTRIIKQYDREVKRIGRMFGTTNIGFDCFSLFDVHRAAFLYREHPERFHQELDRLKSRITRLRSVKKPEHVTRLEGVGKKAAAKILARLNESAKGKTECE